MNHEAFDHRTKTEQRVDAFVQFFGSLKFLVGQTIFIIIWVLFNALTLTGALHFDKYPFILLNLLFSTQSAYAAPLILLSQNRQGDIDRQKSEHDFRVNQEALDGITAIKNHLSIK